MYINNVTLAGRVASDIERKTTKNDLPLMKFRIAVPKFKKGETNFLDVVMFGKPATWFEDLKKGDAISLNGEISQESYEKDGKNHSYISIVASSLIQHNYKKKDEADSPLENVREGNFMSPPAGIVAPEREPAGQNSFDDDIPFK